MPEAIGQLGWRRSRGLARRPGPRAVPRALFALSHTRLVQRLTYLLIAIYAFTFAHLSVLQHQSHNTHAFDLGNMDQAVWNTANGRPFEFTNWEGGRTRLAAHVEPILIPIAQLYRLFSGPETLLVLQAIVISLGALPAFWLARDKLRNDFAAISFASAYLLAPELEAANLSDFHPVALASSFLLFAFWFLHRERYLLFLTFATLAMMTKEQVPISVALLGLYIVVVKRRPWVGWPVVGFAALWFLLAFFVILPANNPQRVSPYLSRYDQLGSSPIEVIATLITDPGRAFPAESLPDKLLYIRQLFAPVAFLAWFSPLTLMPALPDLAINLLSSFEPMYSGGSHYSAVIVPFIIIASIDGLALFARLLARLSVLMVQPFIYTVSGSVLVLSVFAYYHTVVLPLTDNFPQVTDHHRLFNRIKELIPPDAAVSASTTLNPHLSQRRRLYLFPDVADADYVVVDVTASPHPLDYAAFHWRVTGLLNGGEWGWIEARDGYLVIKRGEPNRPLPPEFFTFARPERAPRIERPFLATFGDVVQFLGFSLSPGEVLHQRDGGARLQLFFRPTGRIPRDYLVGVTAFANEHQVSAGYWWPATLWYPMTRWGDEIVMVEVPRVALARQPWVDVYLSLHEPLEHNRPGARLPVRLHSGGRQDLSDGERLWLVRLRGEYW
ncbi:MAG: DUF2079 domain-containing protein [Chloroflexota bacterium]|nr:DUF2079 domain-containing protein [Dehalococcoidia bacterium]MDW8254131.1 DUF2079 domain-containing protein [Chloroflexota bacterium]